MKIRGDERREEGKSLLTYSQILMNVIMPVFVGKGTSVRISWEAMLAQVRLRPKTNTHKKFYQFISSASLPFPFPSRKVLPHPPLFFKHFLVDIDECLNASICASGFYCFNQNGSYVCAGINKESVSQRKTTRE